ncbi:MAG: class IV adenylate cyclase [Christensenellales bacterium]
MKIENEITVLNINKEEFIKMILIAGGKEITPELKQVRCVYDFNPKQENKWIRLRTNGQKTSLTIKEINNNSKLGAKELEIEVSDFEETNRILNQLGYTYRNRQENYRHVFSLDGVEISIDTWPRIDPYAEIEAETQEDIDRILNKLNIPKEKITKLDVCSIYKDIYNIDLLSIKNLTF